MSSSFQTAVYTWALDTFGKEVANDEIQRGHRFLEEALELVQSIEVTKEDAHKLVDYVYSRPVGQVYQELGGVMVTLAVLSEVLNSSMYGEGQIELVRCWQDQDKIRAKQAAKKIDSALPGPSS